MLRRTGCFLLKGEDNKWGAGSNLTKGETSSLLYNGNRPPRDDYNPLSFFIENFSQNSSYYSEWRKSVKLQMLPIHRKRINIISVMVREPWYKTIAFCVDICGEQVNFKRAEFVLDLWKGVRRQFPLRLNRCETRLRVSDEVIRGFDMRGIKMQVPTFTPLPNWFSKCRKLGKPYRAHLIYISQGCSVIIRKTMSTEEISAAKQREE